jgi:hypothetical protein
MSIFSIKLVGIKLKSIQISHEVRHFLLGQSGERWHDKCGAEELFFDVFNGCRAAGVGQVFLFEKAFEPGAEFFILRIGKMAGKAFGVV